MSKRKKVSGNVEVEILTACKRRCAICFGINEDLSEKKGQIAHLDKDRNNNKPDNLCWLCLDHHDQFDSKTSVSKNYTVSEVKKIRAALLTKITKNFVKSKATEKSNDKVSDSIHALLVSCGRVNEFFGGYPSASEAEIKGLELLRDLKEKVLDFGYNEKIIQPLRDFQNRAHIVLDMLRHREKTEEAKSDLKLAFELLKMAISSNV